jgi:hypothetical protein
VFSQLLLGGAISFLNFGIHGVTTAVIVYATRHAADACDEKGMMTRVFALLTVTMTVLTAAHLLEIGIWTFFYHRAGVYPPGDISVFEAAFENYTALGYGDAVPAPGMRIFGPVAALNGLLLIGWSVAIIFEVLRMCELQVGRRKKRGR